MYSVDKKCLQYFVLTFEDGRSVTLEFGGLGGGRSIVSSGLAFSSESLNYGDQRGSFRFGHPKFLESLSGKELVSKEP